MSGVEFQADLTNCDREPIHHIGAIQGFGALLAISGDWLVAHRSANVGDFFEEHREPTIGAPLRDFFSSRTMETLRKASGTLVDDDHVERLFGLDLTGDGPLFDCAMHLSDGLTILEIERHAEGELDRGLMMIRPVVSRLEKCETIEQLGKVAVRQLAELVDYDRVMFYRFRPDESGEVVAENVRDGLGSYLNLRYPRADIPQQARALFVRNRFRIIGDMGAEPVLIEPSRKMGGAPLDLSMSTLRAHSQMHVEYMRNMGVHASLAIAIVVRGRLWGMFACHHYEPRQPAYSIRSIAELFSEFVSLVVERLENGRDTELRSLGDTMHDKLLRGFADGSSIAENLPDIEPVIARAIEHDGSSVFVDGTYRATGHAPSEDEFRALIPALNSAPNSQVLITDELTRMIPESACFADKAAGAIMIPISRSPRDYFVLWRREQARTVTWAGNPEKVVEHGPHGERVTPRGSFEAWKEETKGRSAEWSPAERELAERLRVSLLEVILRLTDEQVRERARAQEQQELLIAELNHRVRNILNLIRSLISQSSHEALDVRDFSELIGGRIRALAVAHDNITRESWSPSPLRELIEAEAGAYLTGKEDRVRIDGPNVLISPEAYTVLALVIHEMMTNSAKYGSLCDRRGRLEIELEVDRDADLRLRWRERGGPPVKAPTRRGFGSTIIEKSIPHELKGDAEIRYRLEGVEADFTIPTRYFSLAEEMHREAAEADTESGASPLKMPDHVMVVEDNLIIAMDVEDCLKEIGIPKVTVAASVDAALAALEKDHPQLALLDYNLGTESSLPVAEELRRLGIPYVLATGYDDGTGELDSSGASGMLRKPYGLTELEELFKGQRPN